MIVQKKYDVFTGTRGWLDLSSVGTTATEGKVLDFGGDIKTQNGTAIFGTEHALELNEGFKLLVVGSHGIAGTGTVTLEYYTDDLTDGDVDKLIGTSGPLTADDLGGGWLDIPAALIHHKLKVSIKASAASAFTAGKIYVTLAAQLG